MKKLLCLLLIAPSLLIAQSHNSGINFLPAMSWHEIKARAKAENKYIFVDCYATWCKPCKLMDSLIYPDSEVGIVMDSAFISVKIQMDSSKRDNEEVKRSYSDAHDIMFQYSIREFPTFLFFNPSGELVHRGIGYKDRQSFISIAKDALDPGKQYYSLLKEYQQGQKNYSQLVYLASTAATLNQRDIARTIAIDYIDNYVFTLKDDKLLTEDNIRFLRQFLVGSDGKLLAIFVNNADKINLVMHNADFAQALVSTIIEREEIEPATVLASLSSRSPDWEKLKNNVKEKYGEYYAGRTITSAKLKWFESKQDLARFTKTTVALVKNYGSGMSNHLLNSHAWNIFQFSKQKKELEAAANWMEKVIETENDSTYMLPAALDTYVSILYKLGRTNESLEYLEKAILIAERYQTDAVIVEEYKKKLDLMKNGKPL
jgi:thioredoxin-related protein